MEERLERQARNEGLMRTVNDRIAVTAEGAAWSSPEHLFDFQCECGKIRGCSGRVMMTRADYERVRTQRDRFAVVPGHETIEIEDVVERDPGFFIVDKRDSFEEFVK